MGCSFSDANWQEEMMNAELAIFQSVEGLNIDLLTLSYTEITVNGEPLKIRTYVYNDDKSKKTLLMTHGYAMSSVFFARLLPELSKHYRIVMFDNLGFGLNSRTENVGDALESTEKAEKWFADWWDQLIEKLDLPPKFYLTGHSAGAAQAMMYVSRHPERCEGLFLMSPAGTEDTSRKGFEYEKYLSTLRVSGDSDKLPYRCAINGYVKKFENCEHIFNSF